MFLPTQPGVWTLTDLAWVKNVSGVPQGVGVFEVPPYEYGQVPRVFAVGLTHHPLVELRVVQPTAAEWPFEFTAHAPWSPRYGGG